MTVPVLTDQDLAELTTLAADLNFADPERRAVLLERGTRDINAAPGSGKTAVLAAKLLLLACRWVHGRKGICVLSHTNVAREEIQRRLGTNPSGSRLLAYPHFIGTIHAFVNQFLALPYMRSNGLEIDIIDDDVFSRRALAIASANWNFRAYMGKNPGVTPMIAGLVYRGPDLDVGSEGGKLPGLNAKTRPLILDIKQTLTNQGIYRYADMFAFAERLLVKSLHIRDRLSTRFPLVFIDEMQDTSWEQEHLLRLIFDDSVVIQRFGDVNQRILGNNDGAEKLTFPRADPLPISTSKRFGPAIAGAVIGVQLGGQPVVGERVDLHAPMLLTYSTDQVDQVISTFGVEVLKRFSEQDLQTGEVKALCARKQSDAKNADPGKSLTDYWPNFANDSKVQGSRVEHFWSLLSVPLLAQQRAGTLADRSGDVRRAVLLALRAAGAEAVKNVRNGQQLLRRLDDAGFDTKPLRLLIRHLALSADLAASQENRQGVPGTLFGPLQPLLPEGMSADQFAALPLFAEPDAPVISEAVRNVCSVEHDGKQIDIQIGSLASMKGETHLATLVLESLGWRSKRFDLQEALPVICGLKTRDPALKESNLSQYRNLYVGMSRPTSFLCLAVNATRVSEECKAAIAGRGWVLRHVG